MSATTLDAIAAELGLTKQGLYYHFASKEALLVAVCIEEWTAAAEAIHEATSKAPSAADALEALVRSYVARYAGRLELFRLATQAMQAKELAAYVGQSELSAFRPLNDRMYGPTEQKLAEAQRLGLADAALDPRRLAFVAHVSAMGLLAMKLMVESVDDPLRHPDEALVAELCRALRASVAPPAGKAPGPAQGARSARR